MHIIATDAAFARLRSAGFLPDYFWLNTESVPNDEREALRKEGRLAGWFQPPFDIRDQSAVRTAIADVTRLEGGGCVTVISE